MTSCTRCGQCCWYLIGPDDKLKKCKHLVTLRSTGKTLCRNYTKRKDLEGSWRMEIDRMKVPFIDKITGKEGHNTHTTYCEFRMGPNSPYDYPDCPYNKTPPRRFPPWLRKHQ